MLDRLCLFIFLFIIVSCAGRDDQSDSADQTKKAYQPLSEAEAKVYITPTIYYIPRYDLSVPRTCSTNVFKKMKNKKGETLLNVCSDIYDNCLMQGTCEIKYNNEVSFFNASDKIENEYRFSQVKNSPCQNGVGAAYKACLQPFYSIAADLSLYKLEQVIYIPDLVGVVLPDGSKHDGFFIVHDSGSSIKGYGRFDFFTGFYSNKKAVNPFTKLGLADKDTHFLYFLVQGSEADEVLKKRKN